MVGALLTRGMMVGIVAGLLCFGFLKLVGEPPVDRAIAFETAIDEAKDKAEADNAKAKGMTMPQQDPEPEELVTACERLLAPADSRGWAGVRVLVTAGRTLALRFNPRGRYLRSFVAPESLFIDIMMNVPLIFYAARATDDRALYDLAVAHCRTSVRSVVRQWAAARS